ncbi:hypothetical protein SAMN05660464_2152 [Geodermatophilus dictyosporus]|uniref:Uncharacterized protein n=1 Tax=Geodermatophilus dictyosporus TaxID=1523247 RepID=A0A1I5MU31_9ACTN|nr:hypothetical protein [Geodermatophilus dictyosporus]SFP13074.1 hypothetical protein SAMN05660464_2152 [Geodermatophilus dictyosporus]
MRPHTAPSGARRWWRPVLVVGLGLAALVVPGTTAAPGVRVVVLLAFLVLGPGLALVGLLDIPDGWRELALAIGVSLALDLVVVAVLAYVGDRTVGHGLLLLAGVTFVGAALQVVALRRRGERDGTAVA